MTYGKESVIIIAAARSGTKLLRYILSASHKFAGYPYDANYIWKYGNYSVMHDEIEPDSIDERKKERIRSRFLQICEKENKPYFLEKSVSNSLRIPFVRSVFPNCKIIHLFRDGLDVAADSMLCWQAPASSTRIQSKADLQRKIKEFPLAMAWPYLLGYGVSYGKKILFKQEHVSYWGPRYKGIEQDILEKSLLEVCAIQWSKCVEHCCDELGKLENGVDFINIQYEKLVYDPEKYFTKIADFIDIDDGEKIVERGIKTSKADFIGSWEKRLSAKEKNVILKIISKTQGRVENLN